MLAIIIIVLHCLIGNIQSDDQCNNLYSNFHDHLATKTAYRFVANYDTKPVEFEGKYLCIIICNLFIY